MAKDKSTQIRDFVKNSLAAYYKNFQVKLDTPKASDVNAAIKIKDGSVYVWGLGEYGKEGYDIDNAITLQKIIQDLSNNIDKNDSSIQNINSSIQDLSNNKISNINADVNIKVERSDVDVSIAALGYTYDQENNYILVGMGSNAPVLQCIPADASDSHAEGRRTIIANQACHVEGAFSAARGIASHAEGYHTTTTNDAEHAEGKYNVSNTGKTIHSVGIGSSSQSKNALEILNDGSIFITGLVTTNSYNGTSITNVSTLQEIINEKLDKSSAAAGLRYDVVQQLPTNPESNVIYLVPSTSSTTGNNYDEYLYDHDSWELIGSTQADLTNYYTKPECNNTFSSVGHDHGNMSNTGNITVTVQQVTSSHSIAVTNAEGKIFKTNVTFNDNGQQTQFLNIRGNWAVPTDTKNTVGATTTTSPQLYIVGAPYSTNSIQSYINTNVYLQNDNIIATGFYQSSDERLKNIKSELSVEDCYKLINDCSTIIYSLKTDEKDQNQIGMIAQQVKEIMPEVVQESNGYYSINYSRLSVVALNLIKSLSERIIELEKDHNKLEELIKRVEKLEK